MSRPSRSGPSMSMTRFLVQHSTTYRYSAEVAASQSTLHVRPRTTTWQTVLQSAVTSEPVATDRDDFVDAFGNNTTYLAVERPHDRFTVIATSAVDVCPPDIPVHDVAWDDLAVQCRDATVPADVVAMSLPSMLAPAEEALADFARKSFPARGGVVAGWRDLTERIFREFVFDPASTDVSTPVLTVLDQRRGVCQDFAHLMVACLRSLGLPARYVSGYIETDAPEGMSKLVGTDASHAWAAAFIPGFGWLDADPTNGGPPVGRHITVAWGRDYADVAPSRGVVFGPPSTQDIDVAVDVTRVTTD